MDLLQTYTTTTTEHTFIIQHPTEGILTYKEYRDDTGKVIDSICRSKQGYEIDNPALLEDVWEFVDEIESKSSTQNNQ